MRLTLRTMLAYMDGILDAKDAEDIRQRIEDSEYASNLLHRTRDVMRKLRLTAPELGERIAGLDPNTVAEYLDNTLPPDGVTDFEKVCLDSDIHLAEVAACHQILTLVLGEPAEIDPDSRDRMYGLPEVADDLQRRQAEQDALRKTAVGVARANGETSGGEPPSDETPGNNGNGKKRHKPVVPDYLREPDKGAGRRRLLPAAAMLLAAAGILALVMFALGQFEPDSGFRQFLARNMGTGETAERASEEASSKGETPGEEAVSPTDQPQDSDGAGGDLFTKDGNIFGKDDESPTGDAAPGEPGAQQPDDPKTVTVITPPTDRGAEPSTKPTPEAPTETGTNPAVDPAADPSGEPATAAGEERPVLQEDTTVVNPLEQPDGTAEPGAEPGEEAPAAPMPPQRMGRLMTADRVLLSHDPQLDDWTRIAPRGSLDSGRRLLALPTNRVELALSADITLQLLGPAQAQLLASEGELPIGLRVDYGRAVIMPIAQAGTKIRLFVGQREGTITFSDAESVVAVEVRPMRRAGSNPETDQVLNLSTVYVTRGEAAWAEPDAEEVVQLRAPSRLDLDDKRTRAPRTAEDFPRWVVAEAISPLDAQAASTLAESLDSDRSASLGLMELSEHRRKEVRWLALRSLTYMGDFDSMVTVLDDAERRSDWPDYIEQLRTAINLSPEVAASLRQALEKEYGKNAPALYRMLWGYTQEGLAEGEAAKLVDYLEHSSLPMRVLSFWNLKEITGLGLFYRPTDLPTKRQVSVRRWRERLAAGEIP